MGEDIRTTLNNELDKALGLISKEWYDITHLLAGLAGGVTIFEAKTLIDRFHHDNKDKLYTYLSSQDLKNNAVLIKEHPLIKEDLFQVLVELEPVRETIELLRSNLKQLINECRDQLTQEHLYSTEYNEITKVLYNFKLIRDRIKFENYRHVDVALVNKPNSGLDDDMIEDMPLRDLKEYVVNDNGDHLMFEEPTQVVNEVLDDMLKPSYPHFSICDLTSQLDGLRLDVRTLKLLVSTLTVNKE